MASFGVEVSKNKELISFIKSTNERLKGENLLKNPYEGKIILCEDLLAVSMSPAWPNVSLYALFICISLGLFTKFMWFLYPGAFFFILNLFWSRYFLYILMWFALKKAKYKGRFKLLGGQETIRRLIEWDKERF